MATTVQKLRWMRKVASKNHDKIIRAYYDEVNAQERGEPLPSAFSVDCEASVTIAQTSSSSNAPSEKFAI